MDKMSFEGLEVWQKAHELKLIIHREIAPKLPSEEKWDLAHQIRSSSKSVCANIAEGHGRFYFLDNVRFCYNARGSLAETINHLIDTRDLGHISHKMYSQARELADTAYRLLNGYIAYIKRRKLGINEPGANIHPGETVDRTDAINRTENTVSDESTHPPTNHQSTNHQSTNHQSTD